MKKGLSLLAFQEDFSDPDDDELELLLKGFEQNRRMAIDLPRDHLASTGKVSSYEEEGDE